MWFNEKPTYSHSRVFGCLAYVHVRKELRTGKFSDTAKKGVLLGYQEGHHNYRVWLLNERKVVYNHDMVFKESIFPFQTSPDAVSSSLNDFSIDESFVEESPIQSPTHSPHDPSIQELSIESQSESDSASSFSDSHLIPSEDIPSSVIADPIVPSRIVEGDSSRSILNNDKSKSTYKLESIEASAPKDISSKIDPKNILTSRTRHKAQTATFNEHTVCQDPTTYNQDTTRPDKDEWIKAITCELTALEDMKVWEEVELPSDAHAIGTTWVFKRKTGPHV